MPKQLMLISAKTKQDICDLAGMLIPDLDVRSARDCQVVAEVCLDAGRLRFYNFKAADDEIGRLINKHGWNRVRNEVALFVPTA